ncbi:50S ribosomal protein L33 [Streptomyces sp. MBT49]|uniref:50S ribosomal protein L33 n=1 Tax=Streptomyces sp. MBT49 TaxID=1488380 RepID=UPI001F44A704|nr:50S ribosomal protein L33 [Streptomyces sp. MBT49]
MARNELRPVIKLRSTVGTGYTYVTRKNRRNDPDRPRPYTGTARVLDTAGRVERFERRYGKRGGE